MSELLSIYPDIRNCSNTWIVVHDISDPDNLFIMSFVVNRDCHLISV